VGGQRHAPAALPSGKTRYPSYTRLGGPQGRFVQVRKISPPTGIQSPDCPARSDSLYRLRYPGPHFTSTYLLVTFLFLRFCTLNPLLLFIILHFYSISPTTPLSTHFSPLLFPPFSAYSHLPMCCHKSALCSLAIPAFKSPNIPTVTPTHALCYTIP